MPPTPEQFDAAIAWLEGKVDDGTFDCLYGLVEGGGFSVTNAESRREILDRLLRVGATPRVAQKSDHPRHGAMIAATGV